MKRLIGLVGSLALVLSLGSAPAHAATWKGTDAKGDGAKAADISRVVFRHQKGSATTTVKFHSLNRQKIDSVIIGLYVKGEKGAGFIISGRNGNNNTFVWKTFYGIPFSDGGAEPFACPGKKITWSDKSVSVKLPRACISPVKKKLAVRVDASTPTRGDVVPEFSLHSKWVAAG